MTTIISLFENPTDAAMLRDRRETITQQITDLRREAAEIDALLERVERITEIYEGVAIEIDPHDPDQTYDVNVRVVERSYGTSRWAKAVRNVRTQQWMVSIHGPGLRSGGELLNYHHDAIADALDAARKWTVLGER